MISRSVTQRQGVLAFSGFKHFVANFIEVPNEFFDIALRLLNGPSLKVLGYLLYRTFGWKDEHGNPIYCDEVTITSSELSTSAGVGERHVNRSLKTLIQYNFIECIREPRKATKGRRALSGIYKVKYAPLGTPYTKDVAHFRGFYSGAGNYTRMPEEFFSYVLPTQNHADTKIVAAVFRETIGWRDLDRPGKRRRTAPLNRDKIKRLTGIRSNETVRRRLDACIDKRFVRRVAEGKWHPNPQHRRPALYAPYYLSTSDVIELSVREKLVLHLSQLEAKCLYSTYQNRPRGARTKIGQEEHVPNQAKSTYQNRPTEHLPNQADIKSLPSNNNNKQNVVAVVMLCDFGFDKKTAIHIADNNPHDVIAKQLGWMPLRKVQKNRLGYARRAIEQDWSAPEPRHLQNSQMSLANRKKAEEAATAKAEAARERRQRNERRLILLAEWGSLTYEQQQQLHQATIEHCTSAARRRILQRHTDLANPPKATLEFMAKHISLVA